MHPIKNFPTALLLLSTLFLVGCGDPELIPLPTGEQTVTGELFPADLSLTRRGSHVLKQDGLEVYFLESTRVNLRSFELKTVILKGVFERNTDPTDLPVLVVAEVESDSGDNPTWSYPSLGITFKAPPEWKAQTTEDGVQFLVEGSSKPVLTIFSEGKDLELSSGFPVLISGERAVRRIDEKTGAESITIERDETFLTLLFSASDQELRQEWLTLLRSIELDSSPSIKPPTGTGATVPCGGSAGVLCGEGYFCNVTNIEENIGICSRLKR
ncbi:hypothetical protein KKF55_01335 [Patescibacteria group bacterium]|nr:hypothetical protein [Patescibacteria group bacterium]